MHTANYTYNGIFVKLGGGSGGSARRPCVSVTVITVCRSAHALTIGEVRLRPSNSGDEPAGRRLDFSFGAYGGALDAPITLFPLRRPLTILVLRPGAR